MNLLNATFKVATLVTVLAISVACSESKDRDKSSKDGNQGATGTLSGNIGSSPFKFARGLAYVRSSDPSKVVVDLFDADGPTGCEVRSGDVWHHYPSQDETESDHITLFIPNAQFNESLKWSSSKPSDVSVFDSLTGNGAGHSFPAIKSLVRIESLNAGGITGTLDIQTQDNADVVSGTFTASFCKGTKI